MEKIYAHGSAGTQRFWALRGDKRGHNSSSDGLNVWCGDMCSLKLEHHNIDLQVNVLQPISASVKALGLDIKYWTHITFYCSSS